MTLDQTTPQPLHASPLPGRRAVAFGAVWLPAMTAAPLLRAQTPSLEEVAKIVSADGAALLEASKELPRGAELSRERIAQIVSLDLEYRVKAFDAFYMFSQSALRDYARVFNVSVAAQYEGLPVVTQFEELPVAPQSRTQIVPMIVPPPRPPSEEPLAVVLVDVVFQSLGIYLGDELIRSILGTDPELEAAFVDAIDAISTEDPDKVVETLEWIVTKLGEGGWLTAVGRVVGPDVASRIQRRLLGRLAIQFFPLIGPAYTLSCVVVAVYNNWDRLKQAI